MFSLIVQGYNVNKDIEKISQCSKNCVLFTISTILDEIVRLTLILCDVITKVLMRQILTVAKVQPYSL